MMHVTGNGILSSKIRGQDLTLTVKYLLLDIVLITGFHFRQVFTN